MNRFLTDVERLMVNRLSTQVTFLPASYDKRFCSGLPVNGKYTDKQIAYINKLFHKYRKQIKDYEQIKSMEDNQPQFTNEEYLDLHGSKENAYLKPRIESGEYLKLPEEKRRFYMRFCGHNEVYYTLNPMIK